MKCVRLDFKIQNWVCESCAASDSRKKRQRRWEKDEMEALHGPNNHMYPYLEGDSHAQLVSPYLEPLKKISTWYPYFFLWKPLGPPAAVCKDSVSLIAIDGWHLQVRPITHLFDLLSESFVWRKQDANAIRKSYHLPFSRVFPVVSHLSSIPKLRLNLFLSARLYLLIQNPRLRHAFFFCP